MSWQEVSVGAHWCPASRGQKCAAFPWMLLFFHHRSENPPLLVRPFSVWRYWLPVGELRTAASSEPVPVSTTLCACALRTAARFSRPSPCAELCYAVSNAVPSLHTGGRAPRRLGRAQRVSSSGPGRSPGPGSLHAGCSALVFSTACMSRWHFASTFSLPTDPCSVNPAHTRSNLLCPVYLSLLSRVLRANAQ